MSRSTSGRVAVVTGGACGIGQAFAQRLAEDGHDVAIADVQTADETIQLIEKAGRRGLALTCDVSSGPSVTSFADAVLGEFGHVDVLVTNAGIYPLNAFVDIPWEEWERVISINLNQQFHFCKAFLPGMMERGWGRIIAISSTTFHAGIGYNSHYNASKGGVIGFYRGLASEIGENGVTCNTIAPGLVRTETTENAPNAQWFEPLAQQQCIKRTEEPSDLVGALSFFASDDSAFITGQTLLVDGGWMRS